MENKKAPLSRVSFCPNRENPGLRRGRPPTAASTNHNALQPQDMQTSNEPRQHRDLDLTAVTLTSLTIYSDG